MSTSLSLTPPSGLDPLILVQKTNPIALSVFLISLISVVTIFFFSLEAAKPEENQKHLCSLSKDRGWITGDATAEPVDFCVLFLLCKEEKNTTCFTLSNGNKESFSTGISGESTATLNSIPTKSMANLSLTSPYNM